MSRASEAIASQVGSGINNQRTWGTIIFNPKDPQYGAMGNGAKDDTTAFSKVISDAKAVKGEVVCPPGTYILSSSLLFSEIKLSGSREGVIFKFVGLPATADGLIIEFSQTYLSTQIEDITIDMNSCGRHGIRVISGDYISIINVNVQNSLSDGVHFEADNSYRWIENFTLDRVKVKNAKGHGFAFIIPATYIQNFINVGNMLNCEVRGVGNGKSAIYGETLSANAQDKISNINVIGGEYDVGNPSASHGIYFKKTASGLIERNILFGLTVENTNGGSVTNSYGIQGVGYAFIVAVLAYNYALGLIPNSLSVSILGSGDGSGRYDKLVLSNSIITPPISPWVGTNPAFTIPSDVGVYVIDSGGNLTLTSTPTIAAGQDGQRIIVYSNNYNTILQDNATLAGSNLRLKAATMTIGPGRCMELIYLMGKWTQVSDPA